MGNKEMINAIDRKAQKKIERGKKIKIVKSLASYLNGSWKYVFLAWFFVALEVVCEVLIPWVAGSYLIPLIDPTEEMVASGFAIVDHVGELWGYACIMLGLAVISCTGGIIAGFMAAKASTLFGRNLRQAMFYKIQDYSFKNIDKFSTPSLVTRLTTDVTNVQNSVQMIVRMVVRSPLMMVFALVMAATVSWQLSLIFLGVIPFLGFVLFFVAIKVHPIFVRVFEAYDGLNGSVEENLRGIRVVKSYGREDYENEKFQGVSKYIYRSFVHAERILAFNSPVMQFSVYVSMLLVSWFGAYIIIHVTGNAKDAFNTGSLTSMITYVNQILMSLMFVSMAFVMIIIARNSAERICEVIDEVPDLASPENPLMEVKDGEVEFDHVCFRYNENGDKDVLHDVNIHIPSGSTVGIIGATGSSKSTFVSMIARLYDVQEGSVKVGGHDVREYDLKVLRDSVAVVLQKNVLFTGTIRSNLLWGNPDATEEDIEKAAKLACVDEFIDRMPGRFDAPIEQGGNNVSGGQKQRLCIARALLKKPKVLILDDSTSAVDTFTDAKIRHAFQTEIPEVTKFIVAQRILSIKDCDIILVLDDGKIIAKGTNDELMKTSDVYREIYQTQIGGGDFDAAE